MCLILLSFRAHRHFPLVVAANRDEHYSRPAAPAGFWDDHPEVYGGRDLEKGGTWMGIHCNGRFAAITNYRAGQPGPAAPRSRGELVSGFLTGNRVATDYFREVAAVAAEFNPFSVIAGDLNALSFYSNRRRARLHRSRRACTASAIICSIPPGPRSKKASPPSAKRVRLDDPDAISTMLFGLLGDRTTCTGSAAARYRHHAPA